jgi:hypothetical protein
MLPFIVQLRCADLKRGTARRAKIAVLVIPVCYSFCRVWRRRTDLLSSARDWLRAQGQTEQKFKARWQHGHQCTLHLQCLHVGDCGLPIQVLTVCRL